MKNSSEEGSEQLRLSAFETYSLYLALKNHFSRENYDFLKYHGKVNASPDSFSRRRDRLMFQKLSRRYDGNDMRDFLLANLLKGRTWIGELLEDEAEENFRQYQKKKQSISYTFSNELDRLFGDISPLQAFKVERKDTYPKVFDELMRENISLETFSILDKYLGLCKIYDEKLGKDDVIWSKYRLLISKLHPFLEYDRAKLKNILMEKIHEHAVL